MTDASWSPLTVPTDKVLFAGRPTPGLAEVIGAVSGRKWEENAGYAMSGAILVYRGIELSHFSVELTLSNDQDWADWAAFKPFIARPPLGKIPRSMQITHPVLDQIDIHYCVIESVSAPEQRDGGVWFITIRCIEYRAPKGNTKSKPEGAEATPVDPLEQQIKNRRAERDKLAADAGN